jgi:hypothetical protein
VATKSKAAYELKHTFLFPLPLTTTGILSS